MVQKQFKYHERKPNSYQFIIFSENQLKNILKEYIEHYNKTRPHQGISQQIPKGYEIKEGEIKSRSILFGLNQEFYREAA